MSEHHHPDPMRGHHRPSESGVRRRWWHVLTLRNRDDQEDHVVRATGTVYPGVFSYVSGHKDVPLTPRARLAWWLTGLAITLGGIALIVLWAR